MSRDPEPGSATVAVSEPARERTASRPSSWWTLAALAIGLPAFFLSLYVARGYGLPVGSDAPVYLWWERLAAFEGLSVVRMRPGVPTLTLVLGGTLRLSQASALATVGVVAATSIGLSTAAWFGERWGPGIGLLGGVLAGTYAADMAGGYYANAVFAALFLAAVVVLVRSEAAGRPGREALAAAVLVGAGGLAHPLFLWLGLAILGLTVLPALIGLTRGIRPDGGSLQVGVAGLGGLGVLGLASLALLVGPDPHAIDTSADAFRRRSGLLPELGRSYVDRFRRRVTRYVVPVSAPLAWAGARAERGLATRVLAAWGAVAALGVAVALATQRVPAARFLGFALVLPIGTTLGLVRLWRWLHASVTPRGGRGVATAVAVVICGGLVLAMIAGAAIPWRRQKPFLNPAEVQRAAVAGAVAAERTAPGTPIVVVVDGADPVAVPFLVARAANVVRDAVPAERIRDVMVYLGSPTRYLAGEPTLIGEPQYDAFSRGHLRDIRGAVARNRREPAAFVLAPFARPVYDEARGLGELVAPGVIALEGPATGAVDAPFGGGSAPPEEPTAEPLDPLAPSSPAGIVAATAAALVLLWLVGFGWARGVVRTRPVAAALAPAFGTAALVLAGLALERLGVPVTGTVGPVLISALAGLGGYLWAGLGLQRRART